MKTAFLYIYLMIVVCCSFAQTINLKAQVIYKNELLNYPNHLFDLPLACESIPMDLMGAIYLFQDQSGKTFVFAIKMTQAKDPKDIGHFGLWFGPLNHPSIQERVKAISSYLEQNGSTVLKSAAL